MEKNEKPALYFSEKLLVLILATSILLVSFLLYGEVSVYPFISLDDFSAIKENPIFNQGICWKNLVWAFTTTHCYSYWIPLTWISFLADRSLYGMNSGGYHLTNLTFHAINSVLLFLFFYKTTNKKLAGFAVALLLVVHPVHVESVAWVSSRKDILCLFFLLFALHMYRVYCLKPTKIRYLSVILLFLLALMAKPMAVMFPFILIVVTWWPIQKSIDNRVYKSTRPVLETISRFTVHLRPVIPFFIISLMFAGINIFWVFNNNAAYSFSSVPFMFRLYHAFQAFMSYLSHLFYPHDLAIYYPINFVITPKLIVTACIGAILFVASTFVFVFLRKKKPYLLSGWLWFCITIIPILGFVQTGSQDIADRFLYVPAIGLYYALVYFLLDTFSRQKRCYRAAMIIIAAIITTLFLTSYKQQKLWSSSEKILSHTIQVTKNNYMVMSYLGGYLCRYGRFDEAKCQFDKALSINPHFVHALYNMGVLSEKIGDLKNSLYYFNEVIKQQPQHPDALTQIGFIYDKTRQDSLARIYYRYAILANPRNYTALKRLEKLDSRIPRVSEKTIIGGLLAHTK
jgi:tetratricopeptide (TPR) repeat protein